MNGISTLVVTFIIFIAAKGELGKYAKLVSVSDVDNQRSSPRSSDTPVGSGRGLPELPSTPIINWNG